MLFQSSLRPTLINRIIPHISSYRQTPFTYQDWVSEHNQQTQYHSVWQGDNVAAFCKTEETRSGFLYLSSFLMAPEYRRTGLSTLFLQSILQEANNRMYTKVLLKVHEDNRAAYRLYKKIGFSEKQKLNNRYEMEYAELK